MRFVDCFYWLERDSTDILDNRVLISTCAWGKNLNWYFRWTLASLLAPNNLPKLSQYGIATRILLYTDEASIEEIRKRSDYSEMIEQVSQYASFEIRSIRVPKTAPERVDLLTDVFSSLVKECIVLRSTFVHAPSDIIFADGSIANGLTAIRGKKTCFAAASPRVSLESFIDNVGDLEDFSPKHLVNCALGYPHATLSNSYDKNALNCTGEGLSVREAGPGILTAIHSLPSVWIAKFDASDLRHFKRYSFNSWDKDWLRKLIREDRVRISGSSNMFFCVELTSDNDKQPRLERNMLNNDRYTRVGGGMEKRVARLLLCTWEGSGLSDTGNKVSP